MIYAYDQALQMPTKDLYDTQMMAMALNAAKDMYERGEQQLKDFNKLYGDFYSPIAKDMEWYNENVTGKMRQVIDDLYARGIDPLRSVEGRTAIARAVNSVPIGTINAMKTNAALYEKRLDAIAKLGDKYNQNMDFALNGDPSQFSTVGKGNKLNAFNYAPPSEYKTIDEIIEPIIKEVNPIYDEAYTKAKNDGNDWYTVTTDRMMQAVNDNMSDILTTPSGRFHYAQAKAEAEALGRPELADAILRNKMANRIRLHENVIPKTNEYKLADYKHRQAQQLALQRHQYALSRQREAAASKATGPKDSGSDGKEQYTDSEFQFRRLSTGILGKTSVGRHLGIGNAAQFDYDLMSGDALRRAQQELIGKYYANDSSKSGGFTRKDVNFKGANFADYQPTRVNLDATIGTGKMSWDEVRRANDKFLGSISKDLSRQKFMAGIDREVLTKQGTPKYVHLTPEDIDRVYTGDYIALSASGMNRPEDLERARKINESVRSRLQSLDNKGTGMRCAGKIVGLVSAIDGQWHTFAKINLAGITPDGMIDGAASDQYNELNGNSIYIDLGIDSYKNPNYGKNGDYSTNMTIDPNGQHEDLRNMWDANVNKQLRVGAPAVQSTTAIPLMYDPNEFIWDDVEDDSDYLDYFN